MAKRSSVPINADHFLCGNHHHHFAGGRIEFDQEVVRFESEVI